MKVLSALLLAALAGSTLAVCPNACSGHGTCNKFDVCVCDDEDKTGYYGNLYDTTKGYERIYYDGISEITTGFSAAAKTLAADGVSLINTAYSDMPDNMLSSNMKNKILTKTAFVGKQYTGPDCSMMTCPKGTSWTAPFFTDPHRYSAAAEGTNKDPLLGHSVCTHKDFVECSDGGTCDRSSGQCQCFPEYTGLACERTVCENDCSGHGQCQSNIAFSKDASLKRAYTRTALTEGQTTALAMQEDPQQVDPRKTYLAAWDSGSHFGCKCDLGYRGEDCSMKECPSSSDPLGFKGNSQGEDCSGRGLCDYSSGTCTCFTGFVGEDCGTVESLV